MTLARILVVEGEPIVARDIQQQLSELGYDPVGHAMQGEEAIALTLALRPDLVLMDVQLTGSMDGITAALALREQVAVPVVFLTAFSAGDTLDRAKLAQPYGYIPKPFSDRELRTVLEMALFKCKAEEQLREAALHTQAIMNKMVDGDLAVECAPEHAAERLRLHYSGARILLVDDDPFNREVASDLLRAVGLRVEMACDGFDAVSLAYAGAYDLVLMDIQMPVLNGLDASRRMRALPGWRSIPILALTANAFATDRQACLDAGMNDLVVKPIVPQSLYAALLQWLAHLVAPQ